MQKSKNSNKKTSKVEKKTSPPHQEKKANPTKSVGAAEFRDNSRTIGLKDLRAHRVSWIAGYTWVGNGTLGVQDSVYFMDNNQVGIISAASGAGAVPLLGSDTYIGKTYVSDIEKHYSRKVVQRARVRVESLNPATGNGMVAVIAPVRGCAGSGDTTRTTGTLAAPAISDVIGMAGAKSCASYDRMELDLTPYIAGGSGARQNEFSINRDGDTAGTVWGAGTLDLVGIAPCAFVVAGTNQTAALRGTIVHMVVVDTWCDYLDFLAGSANPNPLSYTFSKEEASSLIRLILQGGDKEARQSTMFRSLVKAVGSSGPQGFTQL